MRERLLSFLEDFFRRYGIPLLLIGTIAILFGDTIARAEWVQDSSPLIDNIILGMIVGAALASSRFGGSFAATYSLFVSAVCTLQAIGRVMPGVQEITSLEHSDLLWLMHTRLLTLLDRIASWGHSFIQGENIRDTGLFVLLAGLLIWNVSAWLVWCVVRRHSSLGGLLPFGLLFAINVQLRGEGIDYFAIFIFCALLLLAYTSFVGQHDDWDNRRVDYPDELGANWAFSAAMLAILLGLLARAAPLVGTPGGWQTLNDFFHPAVQQVTNTSVQLFSNVNPPPFAPPTVLAQTPDLGNIGAPVPRGSDTVMWISTNEPPPPQAAMAPSNNTRHYWAGDVFAAYDGKGWKPLETSDFQPGTANTTEQVAGRYELDQQIELAAVHGDTLFAASLPITASNGVSLRFDRSGDTAALNGAVSKYAVSSWVAKMSGDDLAKAPADYPPEITATYLQLPASLPERVRTFAARITSDARNPYEKAIQIQNYLRITYAYRLDVPPPPAGRDAVDYFLFDAPGGYCSYFASAMAVVLRAQGVPARVVTGYAMGEYDSVHRAYRVSVGMAHAWVQVYFPGYGWVEFEPTPAYDTFYYKGEPLDTSATANAPKPQPTNSSVSGALQAVGLAALVVLVGGLVWIAMQIEWTGRNPRRQAQLLYWRMRRLLAWMGLRASASVTPFEFLAAIEAPLATRTRVHDALTHTTMLYIQAMFAPQPPARAEIENARRLWWSALGDGLALGFQALCNFARKRWPHIS
jgi:hypothetical protein